MKFKLLTLLCVAALPVLAEAATTTTSTTTTTPPPAPAPASAPYKLDGTALGRLDAALGLCAKADTTNLQTYLRYRAAFIPVLKVIPSDYKSGFNAVLEASQKVTAAALKTQCTQSFGA